MKVLFFSQTRQATGCGEFILKVAYPLTQTELWSSLISTFPNLAPYQNSTRLARNETYLHADEVLQPDDEIAVIPPVSGG